MSYTKKPAIRMPGETYSCASCDDKSFDYSEACQNWRCPDCDDYIHIYAEDTAASDKGDFYRKRADEVMLYELVKPGRMRISCSYAVKGITPLGNGKLGFGLTDYGRLVLEKDDWVTVRIGGG